MMLALINNETVETLRATLMTEYRWTSAQVADLLRRLQRRVGTDVVPKHYPDDVAAAESPRKARRKGR